MKGKDCTAILLFTITITAAKSEKRVEVVFCTECQVGVIWRQQAIIVL